MSRNRCAEPQENARVLTLPGCRHLSKPSRRRCIRRSARFPGKAARSAAAQTLRFPTFADIRSGCTGRGTDRLRAAAFSMEKRPRSIVIVQRGGRRTPCTPAPRSSPALSPKRKCERNFPRKGEAAETGRNGRPPPAKRPAAVASPAPRSGRQGRNGCPDFRSPSRKRPRSAIFSGRRRQVWNISLNFAGT